MGLTNLHHKDDDMKFRDRVTGSRHDPYAVSSRDYVERSPRGRRSLSPRAVEKSRGYLGGGGRGRGDGRSNSVERKEYGWDLRGRRGEPVRPGSPLSSYGIEKRGHYTEGLSRRDLPTEEMQRRYDFVDHVDKKLVVNTGLKPEYRYRHSDTTGALTGKDFDRGRLPDASRHGMSGHESMVSEYPQGNSLRMSKDFGPTSKYGEAGGSYLSSDLDVRGYKDERTQYPDSLRGEKLLPIESYREKENPMYARDISNHQLPESNSKDYINTSQYKELGGTSSGTRVNVLGSYRDGIPSLADEYTRSSSDLKDPYSYSGFGQRFTSDSGRDPKTEHKDVTLLRRDTYSPSRDERHDYTNRRIGSRDTDDYGYPSNEVYRRTDSHAPHVDYYDNEDLLRSGKKFPISERGDNMEYTYSNHRDRSLLDHPSTRKQIASDYLGGTVSTERLYSESSRAEYGISSSRGREISDFGVSKDNEFSVSKTGYGFGRNAGPTSHDDGMRYSPDIRYERETYRASGRRAQITEEEEFGTYGSADRGLKRKYSDDADMSRHTSRSTKSGKWYNSNRKQEYNDSSEKWSGQDLSASHGSRNLGHDERLYGRADRTYDRRDRHRASPSEDWPSSHDHMEHVQEHRSYNPGGKFSRDRLKPGPLSSRLSNNLNRRLVLPKPNNVWVRGRDDKKEDMPEYDTNESEDWGSSGKSEPPEDSEEFKQLVHKAFLIFSKKLNENPSVRKRYKEQGKAGSLFCIVCGRSLSKEFMDTQRLVTHAFMSHKVGLRTQHLGLHKAICVLLGWNSAIPSDVITWVPEVLPEAEATAQREDLIVWPPVVIIHDRSIAGTKADESGITVEAVGDFLRGKGFSGGKFRVCRGKPGDQSVMVVKFLGTFSGLEDAERLHNYFSENKQGRIDFQQSAASSSIKSKGSSNGGGNNSKKEPVVLEGLNLELALFGYLAIAEDLDKVDLDAKKKCLIKSKNEILDLANAPVKP